VAPAHRLAHDLGLGARPARFGRGVVSIVYRNPPAKRLVHELAHFAAGAITGSAGCTFGGCLCWWNPLFWYVSRQVRENAD